MVQQLVARCWPCKAGVASRIFFKAGSVARWLLDPCAAWFGGRLCKGKRPYLTNARFTHVVFLVLGVLVIASGFWSLQQLALPNWLPEVCRPELGWFVSSRLPLDAVYEILPHVLNSHRKHTSLWAANRCLVRYLFSTSQPKERLGILFLAGRARL